MSLLIVPELLTAKLASADGPVELVAADGRRLGYFTPGPAKTYRLDPPGTPADWEREYQAGGGRPLADILRDLEGAGVNYTVSWLPAAEAGLANAWLASLDRDALTAAAAEIDARLAADGPTVGESRDGPNRITFERPLAVLFRADPAARTVSVIRAWEFR